MRMNARTLGIALIALAPMTGFAQPAADQEAALAEYEALLRDIRGLQLYNALLQRQIEAQGTELTQVQQAIADVPELERQLPPLLIEMVDGLEAFIERDVPFLTGERNERVADLYSLIEDPDTNNAAKLRQILESWLIEVQYGGELLTEEGTVEIDGSERNVDFLIIGRVGLIYQTADDEAITGAWDYRSNQWVELGGEHRNQVRQAIRMALNQIAPELVLLPTVPPQTD